MFTIQELNKHIDNRYFNVIDKSAFTVTLQSKNTQHYWHLLNRECRNHSIVIIYHNHHFGMDYHEQCHTRDLAQAIEFIRDHDKYQLTVRDVKKKEGPLYHKQTRRSLNRI